MNSSNIRKFRSEIREYKKELKEQGKKFTYDDKVARDIFKKYHPCYFYAINSVNDENVPKYVQLQCQQFLDEFDRQDEEGSKFVLDMKYVIKITNSLKNINFASGMRIGTPVLYGLAQFQWFFIINTLCWKYKSNLEKRRYEKSVLLIGRKSGKSFLVGLIFILLLLIEPTYSEFYSVAPDRELSTIVKKEAEQLISVSEGLSRWFKINNKEILCKATKSKFVPLALSNNRMDGRKANVFVADEVGALPTRYAIDAMQSSQMNMP